MTDKQDFSAFWNRMARRYARMAISNPAAYEATLDRVKNHLRPTDRVLELGCGTGATALRLAGSVAEYHASDYALEMIAIAREGKAEAAVKNLTLHLARPGDGSLPEGPFDVVLAFNVLHLLPDRHAAFAEIAALMRPEGLFISKTPCLSGTYRALLPVVALLRLFGKAPQFSFLSTQMLERDIEVAGFTIIERGAYPKGSTRHFIVASRK